MLKSVLSNPKKLLVICSVVAVAAISYCFGPDMTDQDWLNWGNKCLTDSYDSSTDLKLKKWELVLTDDSFVRLWKTYQNGKQEYFSFQLHRFDDLNYTGNETNGILQLKAKGDYIIVQTHNDRQGDVDSMATVLSIPVKGMPAERVDSLRQTLNYFKNKTL